MRHFRFVSFVDVTAWSGLVLLATLLAHMPASAAERAEVLVADFEGKDYGAWKVSGEAFGTGPARGTLPGQMAVDGFLGKGLVNSFLKGDATVGALSSPPFTLERNYLQFLIGGGMDPARTCLNLKIDGKIVRTATGPNNRPGGTERLDWAQWDVSEFAGRTATIEIVDQATGGWGHINVDHIIQTDRKRPGLVLDPVRRIDVTHRYLNLPVKHGAPKRRLSVTVEGRIVREFEIELADREADFWVFLDLAPFQGRQAALKVDRLPEDSEALRNVDQADTIKGATNLYHEPLRPQFHFSSRRGWNNDPNGLVFYKGEYHLFYQHNPYGWDWGNMHWGHAVSPDLVHWKELPIAIYPARFGDWVFSGSAVIDWRNSGGFQTGGEEPLVAAYTSTGRGECIAFSTDRGRTFTDFSGNPVVKHEGRDPKVFWHEPTQRWVMAVYDEFEKGRHIAFYTSPNLKTWEFQSRIEGFFECPDLFELPVDGNSADRKWVLTAASSEYRIGQFDGKSFTPETAMLPGHRGEAFYAALTYSDIPPSDGRRIQIGWGQIATPGMPFNQMMMFPCELSLRTTAEGIRLCFKPVKEIETLHAKTHRWQNLKLNPGDNPLSDVRGELFDLRVEWSAGDARQVRLNLRGNPVVYDAARQELSCKGRKNALRPVEGRVRLQVLVDRTSLEIFGNDGVLYMPMRATTSTGNQGLELAAEGGSAMLHSLQVHELRPSW